MKYPWGYEYGCFIGLMSEEENMDLWELHATGHLIQQSIHDRCKSTLKVSCIWGPLAYRMPLKVQSTYAWGPWKKGLSVTHSPSLCNGLSLSQVTFCMQAYLRSVLIE